MSRLLQISAVFERALLPPSAPESLDLTLLPGPFGSPWLHKQAHRLLPFWFLACASGFLIWIAVQPGVFGFDAHIYHRATAAWVSGGDPWAQSYRGFLFAAAPPTLLVALPFLPLGENVTAILWVAISFGSALWVLRRLHLAWWWLLFPPLLEGIWVGNPNVIIVALLVAGGRTGAAISVLAKIYAAVPLVLMGRRRELAAAAAALLVTAPLLPWADFLARWPTLSATLTQQAAGGRSAIAFPVMLPFALAAIAGMGRYRAAWLAVPALWPATQSHYTVLALPVMHPLLAAVMAYPNPMAQIVGIVLYGGLVIWISRGAQRQRAFGARAAGRVAVTPSRSPSP